MENEAKCKCKHCGIELPISHTGPCPKCGKTGKVVEASATVTVGIKVFKPRWLCHSNWFDAARISLHSRYTSGCTSSNK